MGTSHPRGASAAFALVFALTACDARLVRDGGTGADAPGRDAGLLDGARPRDADVYDAGPNDASVADADRADGSHTDSDAGSPIALCWPGCSSATDCATASPAFDADNYRCETNVCRYTGCRSDAECQGSFASDRYVCRDTGVGIATCVLGCLTHSDCSSGTAAFDADNYRCEAGACIYEGCNDDTECAVSFGAGYGCRDVAIPKTIVPIPTALRNCVLLCTTSADCGDSGAFGADNYECRAGGCAYIGCHDDAECRASFANPSYVCR